jgi:hypothetical protein
VALGVEVKAFDIWFRGFIFDTCLDIMVVEIGDFRLELYTR